jgi:hypothetical protein
MTSNPSIFEKAIADSHDYDEDIRAMALKGKGAEAIYETISQRDVRSAADIIDPLVQFLSSHGGDDRAAGIAVPGKRSGQAGRLSDSRLPQVGISEKASRVIQ